MWCSFEEAPLILRVYGRGKVLDKGTEGFSVIFNAQFSGYEERIVRQIFEIECRICLKELRLGRSVHAFY